MSWPVATLLEQTNIPRRSRFGELWGAEDGKSSIRQILEPSLGRPPKRIGPDHHGSDAVFPRASRFNVSSVLPSIILRAYIWFVLHHELNLAPRR